MANADVYTTAFTQNDNWIDINDRGLYGVGSAENAGNDFGG
jgi:hypothetical protein